MASLQEKLVGAFGSDIYAAGTYYVVTDKAYSRLRFPIFAIEYAGSDVTITNAKDSSGGNVEQNWCNESTAITSVMGLMVFREDVYSFTCNVAVKVWYAK